MKSPMRWFATMAVAAVLCGATTTALAGDGARKAGKGGRRDGRHRAARVERAGGRNAARTGSVRGRLHRARHARKEAFQALDITADQQRLALEKARAAQPVVAEARKELARLVVQHESTGTTGATPGATGAADARKARRDAVRALRERTAERLAPLAKDVLGALSPEQRAKLEGFAAARGRKFDEARFVKRVGRWLARPMTADLLEAKLGTR